MRLTPFAQFCASLTLLFISYHVLAGDVSMPNFVQGSADLTQTANTKGKALVDLAGVIAVIFCALGIITGIIKMNGGNSDDGKERIKNSVIGLIVLGSLYGLIRFAVS